MIQTECAEYPGIQHSTAVVPDLVLTRVICNRVPVPTPGLPDHNLQGWGLGFSICQTSHRISTHWEILAHLPERKSVRPRTEDQELGEMSPKGRT